MEFPGRGARFRDPFVRSFRPLADELADTVVRASPGRYVFFGHSLGALVAYESAYSLRSRGYHPPLALFVACCPAPSERSPSRKPWTDDELIEELRNRNGTPAEVFQHPELLRCALDQLAADFAVCDDFSHDATRSPLDIPIHVFGGTDDDIAEHSLTAWEFETTAASTVAMVPGNHFFFHQNPKIILTRLEQAISALLPADAPPSGDLDVVFQSPKS